MRARWALSRCSCSFFWLWQRLASTTYSLMFAPGRWNKAALGPYKSAMNDEKLHDLTAWVTEAGLTGTEETAMLAGFCERALAAGLPLGSLVVVVDTLHPTHEGHAIRWRRDEPETVF